MCEIVIPFAMKSLHRMFNGLTFSLMTLHDTAEDGAQAVIVELSVLGASFSLVPEANSTATASDPFTSPHALLTQPHRQTPGVFWTKDVYGPSGCLKF